MENDKLVKKKSMNKKDIEKGMTDVNINDGIKVLVKKIVDNMAKEDKASPMFEHILKNVEYIKDPEEFNSMALYPIKRVIRTFVSTQFKEENYLANDIYTNYDFFEDNVSELCRKFEGNFACADKARTLLRFAVKWKETGTVPQFNWKQRYTFHYPKTGTAEQWMNFIDGLCGLLYGNNQKYLSALEELKKEHSNKPYQDGVDDKGK